MASSRVNASTFIGEDGQVYVDKKRYLWLVSFITPLVALIGPLAFMQTGQEWNLWIFLPFLYVVVPLIDYLIGEDTSNPPESVVKQLEQDNYYKVIAWLQVPVVVGVFVFIAWFVASYEISAFGYIGASLAAGFLGGHGLNIGHELGHKKDKLSQWLAKIILAPAAYGHFFIEHNKGHHRFVATPEDPASSKMGENIYSFAMRELPGAFTRAYEIEKERLQAKGKSQFSVESEFLQPALMTIGFYLALAVVFGLQVVPCLLIAAFYSMWQLTSANYIEHYGLLRQKLPNGKYERPQPHHSWNSNHIFSNWALFHLQRHSDHHANPTRSYQSLRHFDDLPGLPSGYFGMYPLAYIPPIWFAVMNPRLVDLVDGDISKINVLPKRREELQQKYNLGFGCHAYDSGMSFE